MNTMLNYVQRVGAWDNNLYINIHHKMVLSDDRIIFPGNAVRTPQEAVRSATYWAQRGYDVYMAMGGMLECLPAKGGSPFPGAVRNHNNVTVCKCLYIDVDVKEDDPNAYSNRNELITAVKRFIREAKIPCFSYGVNSGTGGLHLYWTMRDLFQPQDFRTLSKSLVAAGREYGLKFDQQCTNDICRLLRVAGTWNFKRTPALPVEVFYDSGKDIDIEEMRQALSRFTPITLKSSNTQQYNANDDLGAGIYDDTPPIPIGPLLQACSFVREVYNNPETRYSEPLWKHCISLACYTENPDEFARGVSRDPEAYIEKLNQARTDRAANVQLGPPLCATIHADGATQCESCPHYALGTTPIWIPGVRPINGHKHLTPVTTSDLPGSYYRGDNDWIFINEEDESGALLPRVVFEYPIIKNSGFIQNGEPYRLVFNTIEAGGEISRVFDCGIFSDKFAFVRSFLNCGLPLTQNPDPSRRFFLNYLKLLQSQASTIITVPPFGWHEDAGVTGFAYDGVFVSPKGEYRCHREPSIGKEYTVRGTTEAFKKLANLIITPDRPDLAIALASSFAAPLVQLTGHHGFLVGIWSPESGVGKTTALTLGQSVWSIPSIGGYNDTVNYTFSKAATLKNLPLIYDEIKGARQTASFQELILQLSGGHERGRSNRDGSMKGVRMWDTSLIYAANNSMVDAAAESSPGTYASVYRIFEFRALTPRSIIPSTDVLALSAALHNNYGGIGREYTAFLGKNYEYIFNEVRKHQHALNKELNMEPAERFWGASICTVLVAAWIAKHLGFVPFNLSSMKEFMLAELARMRKVRIEAPTDYSNVRAVYNELANFINDNRETTIITDIAWVKTGRPIKDAVKIKNDTKLIHTVGIQISGAPLRIRFRDSALSKWCRERQKPKNALCEAIRSMGIGSMANGRLAAGTRLAGMTEQVWHIEVTGTPLEDTVEYAVQYGLLP